MYSALDYIYALGSVLWFDLCFNLDLVNAWLAGVELNQREREAVASNPCLTDDSSLKNP